MLEKLRLQNFQKHEDQEIIFDPLVTTIIGPSDSGKSAILRGMRWLFLNHPRGDSFVRHGQDFCEVTVVMDGQEISRYRGKEGNSYSLNGERYDTIGSAIPQSIQDLLCLSEENIQQQLSPPFWLTLTGSELAKELNGIVNLGEIDQVFDRSSSQIRRLRAEEGIVTERLENAKKEVERLHWVSQAECEYGRLEGLQEELERNKHQQEMLDEYLFQGQEAGIAASFSNEVNSLLELLQQIERSQVRNGELHGQVITAQILQEKVQYLETVTNLVTDLTVAMEESQRWNRLAELLEQYQEEVSKWEQLRAHQQELQDRLSQINTCPLCQQSLNP